MYVCMHVFMYVRREVKVIDANGESLTAAPTAPENCMSFVFVSDREV